MTDCTTFEILPGLPGYGPIAEAFTATGKGASREGFVVGFTPANGEAWVGNFQPGLTRFSGVFQLPGENALVVVSRGQGYVVDPCHKSLRRFLRADISNVYSVSELPGLVLNLGTDFIAINHTGELWRTRRFSWDGIYDVEIRYPQLHGLTWSPFSDSDVPFTVDLVTGVATGGSYYE